MSGFWNFLKRSEKIVEANANATLDKIEDPVVMTN
jgi:phage shock protein A